MAKEKFTLDDLKVNSFVTALEPGQMQEIKGGTIIIKGRRFVYTTRWTTVDTRVEPPSATGVPGGNNGF
ncbi:MAG: pinensin family lanthipeptide [Saprospiraceae bacterium]|nr:pinensin family lanthipeptide [Saprospiraceae bacterium]MCC7503746.1 pinensin family lanthipeptide [Saprospiraceae bacterium]